MRSEVAILDRVCISPFQHGQASTFLPVRPGLCNALATQTAGGLLSPASAPRLSGKSSVLLGALALLRGAVVNCDSSARRPSRRPGRPGRRRRQHRARGTAGVQVNCDKAGAGDAVAEAAAAAARAATARAAAIHAVAEEGSAVWQGSANLAKNICGSGTLALPAGVAAFWGRPEAVWPAMAALLVSGAWAGYGFLLLGRICAATGSDSYTEAWRRSLGKQGDWLPGFFCLFECCIECIFLGIVARECVLTVMPWLSGRQVLVTLLLHAAVFYPICRIERLSTLARYSAFGILSLAFVASFVVWRCLDGTYATSWVTGGFAGWKGMLVMLSIMTKCFTAHYSSPKLYTETRPDRLTKSRLQPFKYVVSIGFAASTSVYAAVLLGGFLTFGGASQVPVLSNYSATDGVATAARLAMFVSLVPTYAIPFRSLRDGVISSLETWQPGCWEPYRRSQRSTVTLLAVMAVFACIVKPGPAAALGGALAGSFLVYLAPPLMHSKLVTQGSSSWYVHRILAGLGGLVGILGVAAVILK
mmetsp:Transcript_130071/g.277834  ORF Transcript_130071/g.277834 Transcript_130071/m.277834 type:complete len:531 (+) Transcript_130071:88-1680(+)